MKTKLILISFLSLTCLQATDLSLRNTKDLKMVNKKSIQNSFTIKKELRKIYNQEEEKYQEAKRFNYLRGLIEQEEIFDFAEEQVRSKEDVVLAIMDLIEPVKKISMQRKKELFDYEKKYKLDIKRPKKFDDPNYLEIK